MQIIWANRCNKSTRLALIDLMKDDLTDILSFLVQKSSKLLKLKDLGPLYAKSNAIELMQEICIENGVTYHQTM